MAFHRDRSKSVGKRQPAFTIAPESISGKQMMRFGAEVPWFQARKGPFEGASWDANISGDDRSGRRSG
ncbi:hypothetical protein RB12810 [Rhodopirellula baltica SH 1]|uniref:Uncharacterized protein n=1 Tax=Rhodopirellula baltica (strain DSM 10527 / NCIMB 13988 / SH1) TaxID=243090 RepID=Q7UI22_RHOBA|nr:hypothetical protein RB12810 [Rhodopirellula baltica SH 1]